MAGRRLDDPLQRWGPGHRRGLAGQRRMSQTPRVSPPVRWQSKVRGDLESEAKGGQVSI